MIEIAIQEIQNYDMVQIFEKALSGEKVVLTHNGKELYLAPNQNLSEEEKRIAILLDEFFNKVQAKFPPDFKFDREEANSR